MASFVHIRTLIVIFFCLPVVSVVSLKTNIYNVNVLAFYYILSLYPNLFCFTHSAKHQKGKNQSLRKTIAERRLRETLPNLIEEKTQHRTTESSISMATQQSVTSLPAISKKLFLVSGHNSPTDDEL